MTGKVRTLDIDVTEEQIKEYNAGALIQDAFSNISPDEREFIKTGVTSEEWDEMFG